MKNLHWTTLKETEGTVWGNVGGLGDEFSDIFSDLKDEFKVKEKKKKEDSKKKKKDTSTTSKITLITDGKRSQNINIMLGRLTHHGKRTMDNIANLLLHLDASSIGADGLESILNNIPNKSEIKTITDFAKEQKTSIERLGKPEKYVLALSTVPHLTQRLQAMLFKLNVDELHSSILEDTQKVQSACSDLKNSDKFVRLLGIVLEGK